MFILAHLAIDHRAQMQRRRIGDLRPSNQTGAQRRIRVEALGETPLRYAACQRGVALQFARRDVVADGVGADVGEGLIAGDVLGVFADYDALFGVRT